MQLKDIVPFGRTLDEYVRMFELAPADLQRRILGCGDGPASFNADASAAGHRVISCDPIYAFSTAEIRQRIDVVVPEVMHQLALNTGNFVWTDFRDIDDVRDRRMKAMRWFLEDYDTGRAQGRYVLGALPNLPFADGAFDLALVSHFLFLYSAHVDLAFHLAGIAELLRVAREVRIFPLVDLLCKRSAFVDPVQAHFRAAGVQVAIQPVPYEFQRGANEMLVLKKP